MIDFHCHILPNVDDGPTSLEESLAMARCFVADHITHVFATPHCHRYVHWLSEGIIPRVESLQKELEAAKIPLRVLAGSEIQVVETAEYRREFEAGVFCHLGNKRSFTLMEFNWVRAAFPMDATELVKWICDQGTTPIIAHPERHEFFLKEPFLLEKLVTAGAWVQITVDSMLGNHGPMPKSASESLLGKYPLAVLATDAHNLKRCSGLSPGYRLVEEHWGKDRRDDLLQRAKQVLAACA